MGAPKHFWGDGAAPGAGSQWNTQGYWVSGPTPLTDPTCPPQLLPGSNAQTVKQITGLVYQEKVS